MSDTAQISANGIGVGGATASEYLNVESTRGGRWKCDRRRRLVSHKDDLLRDEKEENKQLLGCVPYYCVRLIPPENDHYPSG